LAAATRRPYTTLLRSRHVQFGDREHAARVRPGHTPALDQRSHCVPTTTRSPAARSPATSTLPPIGVPASTGTVRVESPSLTSTKDRKSTRLNSSHVKT